MTRIGSNQFENKISKEKTVIIMSINNLNLGDLTFKKFNPLSPKNDYIRQARIAPNAIVKHIHKRLLFPLYKY